MERGLGARARRTFAEEGYLLVPGAVDAPEVARLRARIAEDLAEDLRLGVLPASVESSFCPGLRHRPAMWRWLDQPEVAAALRDLLEGPYLPPSEVQIALRFPEHRAHAETPRPHVDGVPTPGNGLAPGRLHRPALLLGLYLTPLPSPDRGNLLVWPRSHLALEEAFHALGPEERGPSQLLRILEGLPLGPPVAITARPGDLILCHPMLAHAGGPNLSLHVREALYLRLRPSIGASARGRTMQSRFPS